jgi:hypothetical protein
VPAPPPIEPPAPPPPEWIAPPSIPSQGGKVLAHPAIVTVTFADDPNAALAESYGDWVVGSAWLAAAKEYGVSTGTHANKVQIARNAPMTASRGDVEAIVAEAMTGLTATDDTLVAVWFPKTTKLTLSNLTHCGSFSGYHAETGAGIAFAAIGDCPTYVTGLSETENIMRTASHEIIEASTDPRTDTNPAWVALDPANPWSILGEVGDVCPLSGIVRDGAFVAQRYWSNEAAKVRAGDPCVPAPAGASYSTSVAPIDTQTVAAGAKVTFDLVGAATDTSLEWTIQVKPLLGTLQATTTLGGSTMRDGATTRLAFDVAKDAASGTYGAWGVYAYRTPDDFHYRLVVLAVP